MALCQFCKRRFRNSQAVRAHLKSCSRYITRGLVKTVQRSKSLVRRLKRMTTPEELEEWPEEEVSREPREPREPSTRGSQEPPERGPLFGYCELHKPRVPLNTEEEVLFHCGKCIRAEFDEMRELTRRLRR